MMQINGKVFVLARAIVVVSLLMAADCQTSEADEAGKSLSEMKALMGRYIELFNASDAVAISQEIYAAPVLQINPETGEHHVLKTTEEVEKFWADQFEAIKSKGWVRSVVDDIDFRMAGSDMAIASIRFSRLRANGEPIPPARRMANYVFLKTNEDWRIILVSSHPEQDKPNTARTTETLTQLMGQYVDLLNGEEPAAGVVGEIYQHPRLSLGFSEPRNHGTTLTKKESEERLSGYLNKLKTEGLDEIVVDHLEVWPVSSNLAFVKLVSNRVKSDGSPIPPANTPFTYVWLKKKSGWRMIVTLAHRMEENRLKAEAFSIDRLDWLTGRWQGPFGEAVLEEAWLPPKANTLGAVVRLTQNGKTEFVEIIKIEELGDTLELRLRLFDSELKPRVVEPRVHHAVAQDEHSITFHGVSPKAHRMLQYELTETGQFVIRLETSDGQNLTIQLTRSDESP